MPLAAVSSNGWPSGYIEYLWSAVDSSTRNSLNSRGSAVVSALACDVDKVWRWTGLANEKGGRAAPQIQTLSPRAASRPNGA